MNDIGAMIVALRRDKGWNQKDVLTKFDLAGVHMSQPTLSAIEGQHRGVTPKELKTFAEIFGIDVNELL